eukprot:2899787-Rhodomonas_salina.1
MLYPVPVGLVLGQCVHHARNSSYKSSPRVYITLGHPCTSPRPVCASHCGLPLPVLASCKDHATKSFFESTKSFYEILLRVYRRGAATLLVLVCRRGADRVAPVGLVVQSARTLYTVPEGLVLGQCVYHARNSCERWSQVPTRKNEIEETTLLGVGEEQTGLLQQVSSYIFGGTGAS